MIIFNYISVITLEANTTTSTISMVDLEKLMFDIYICINVILFLLLVPCYFYIINCKSSLYILKLSAIYVKVGEQIHQIWKTSAQFYYLFSLISLYAYSMSLLWWETAIIPLGWQSVILFFTTRHTKMMIQVFTFEDCNLGCSSIHLSLCSMLNEWKLIITLHNLCQIMMLLLIL